MEDRGDVGIAELLSPPRRRCVRVDDDPLPSSLASRVGDMSMDSVDLDLTRVSIQSDAEYVEGIDWYALYQARFFLTKRWSLHDEKPEAAVLDSSIESTSNPPSPHRGSWSSSERHADEIGPLQQRSLRAHAFRLADKYLVGHTDSVYCVRFDSRPFHLLSEMAEALLQKHGNGPLYDPKASLGLGSYGKILSGSRDHTIRIWDGDSGICLFALKGHDGSVLCLEYDDEYLFSAGSDRSCIVWDLKAIEKGFAPMAIKRLRGHTEGILDLATTKQWLITCSKDKTVRVYDRTKECKLTRIYAQHGGPINAGTLNYSPVDGKTRAVTASGEGGVHLWDVESGNVIRNYAGHAKGLASVKFQDNRIVTGSNDTTVRVWDAETGDCICVCQGHENLVRAVGFDPKRKVILSGGYDGKVKLFYVGKELHQDAILPTGGGTVQALLNIDAAHLTRVFDVQMDVTRILCCGEDNNICVRDFGRGSPLMRLFV
jgi:WD40 repeat protein